VQPEEPLERARVAALGRAHPAALAALDLGAPEVAGLGQVYRSHLRHTFARRREVPTGGYGSGGVRRVVQLVAIAVVAGTAAVARAEPPTVPAGAIRPPHVKVDMDENPANLASAVVTHAFGLLPTYIDAGNYRLLPFDPFRPQSPGVRTVRVYRMTIPRTKLVLDTAMTSALTSGDARADAASYRVAVSLDGATVPHPQDYWVFYRNNGPLICRIYFPGDLGSLNMGVHSLVLRPLTAGSHSIRVVVHRTLAGRNATLVTEYALRVLPRRPTRKERLSAPEENANPATLGNTPLTFRAPRS